MFYGQSLKFDVPGPGQYTNNGKQSEIAFSSLPKNSFRSNKTIRPGTFQQPRNNKIMRKSFAVFDSQAKRFNTKGMNSYLTQAATASTVGPGSYVNHENPMVKKSFNMSMEHCYFL